MIATTLDGLSLKLDSDHTWSGDTGSGDGGSGESGYWVKGDPSFSCDQVCTLEDMNCNADRMSGMDTAQKVMDAFKIAGYDCNVFRFPPVDDSIAPYSNETPVDDCVPIKQGVKSDCARWGYGYSRLCYCEF